MLGIILRPRSVLKFHAISCVECDSATSLHWPMRLSTRSTSAFLPVRKVQPGTSADCLAAYCFISCGVSRVGSVERVTKTMSLPNAGPSLARTAFIDCVMSGQASEQWV